MEEEILKKIAEQDKKLEEIYRSVEKTRKYFLWTLVVTVAVFLLPLLGILLVIPQFLKIITGAGLDL